MVNYPLLYNSENVKVAILDNIIKDSSEIKRVVNGEFSFKFSAFKKELKSEYFEEGGTILTDSQRFDLKYVETEHVDNKVTYNLEYEHVNYRLLDGEDNKYDSYTNTGTPEEILEDILDGTDFSTGDFDFTDEVTLTVNQEITKKMLIKELASMLGGEIEYTNEGFTIGIKATIGQNNNFIVRFGKNLQGITKIIDYRGETKTYYKIALLELKNSEIYKEKDLGDLEVIEEGDTIRIIDEELGIDVENRIISRTYNPIFRKTTTLEIANTIEQITTKVKQIETNMVELNKPYNNVSISGENGFMAIRSDLMARAKYASDNIALQKGDGLGNYTDAVYYDWLEGEYNFIGNINASGIITGADFIGGTINIGDGDFTVNESGQVSCSDISIVGGSGIGNFDDAGKLAEQDSVDLSNPLDVTNVGDVALLDEITETYIANDSISTPKLKANSVTSTEINVTNLSSINNDLGIITDGTMTIGSNNKIKIWESGTTGTIDFLNSSNDMVASLSASGDTCTWYGVDDMTILATERLFIRSTLKPVSIEAPSASAGNISLDANNYVNIDAGINISLDADGDVLLDAGDDIVLNPTSKAYYGSKAVSDDEIATIGDLDDYATESWVQSNHRLDTISEGSGIDITGGSYDKTISVDTTYLDGRYVNAGTGGSKTITKINATGTGLVVWFTDDTNETIYYD
jgi:hypothetical protein